MVYFIITEENGKEAALTLPLEQEEITYMRKTVIPALKPLSKDDYINGPAGILGSEAPYSYVLDGNYVYWCVEWEPGLLVIRFSADGKMHWAGFKSPDPGFAGRTGTLAEWEAFDENARDMQYELVYQAWDAQYDDSDRSEWSAATRQLRRTFEAAIEHVNKWHDELETSFGDDADKLDEWRARCEQSPIWTGEAALG